MSFKILIIGCGYIGLPLALRLKERGDEVTGWVHSTASAEALVEHELRRVIVGNVGHSKVWKTVDKDYDVVVHCASSGRGNSEAYEQVFLAGMMNIHEHLPIARQLFVSSTSVYGQAQGEWVTELSVADPEAETGRILRMAEGVALTGHALVVRSSGIYGPGRGVLFEKFKRGEAVIEGDGSRWMNQIHQHDLVSAIEHLISTGDIGQIYNVTDDAPVTQKDFYKWCSEFLGKPLPPYGPVNLNRKRGLTNKRVSNAKLKGTGWKPAFPSFREGIEKSF